MNLKWKKRVLGLALALAVWTAAPLQAAVLGLGVTAKGGTTGIGGDLTIPIIENWVNLRAGYNWLEFRPSIKEGGIDYKGDVNLETVPILLDLHPLHGSFRVTAGVFYNNSELGLTTTPSGPIQVGGTTFTPAQVGSLRGNVFWDNEFAPYLGIGWGNAADDNFLDLPVAIGFSVDIGAFYQDSPSATLTQVGGTATIPQSELDAEARQIEDDLSGFKFYPVVTVGLHIRF